MSNKIIIYSNDIEINSTKKKNVKIVKSMSLNPRFNMIFRNQLTTRNEKVSFTHFEIRKILYESDIMYMYDFNISVFCSLQK